MALTSKGFLIPFLMNYSWVGELMTGGKSKVLRELEGSIGVKVDLSAGCELCIQSNENRRSKD